MKKCERKHEREEKGEMWEVEEKRELKKERGRDQGNMKDKEIENG